MLLPYKCRPSTGPVDEAERRAWSVAADHYLVHCDREANWNKLIEIPAMRELLGDPGGKRTLEVGCGPAHYSIWLAQRGAEAHGLDPAARLLDSARDSADAADVHLHLRHGGVELLADYPEAHFDIVLFPMMLEYVDDLADAFGQARRILKPSGFVAISIVHPMRHFSEDSVLEDGTKARIVCNYLGEDVIEWSGWVMADEEGNDVQCKSRRRPIQAYTGALVSAGFLIEALVEPAAVPEASDIDPRVAASNAHCPQFLLLKAVPDPR